MNYKSTLLTLLILCACFTGKAQQFALFGSETIFDSFENPAQKSFTLDSSRKFSSNFFFPYFGANVANRGSSSDVVRKMVQQGITNSKNLLLGTDEVNTIYQNSNVYLATFRIFQSYKHQKEIGFAWQVRSDLNFKYPNELLAIFDSYKRFETNTPLYNVFNAKGYEQTYHQFSFTYRENYNKNLSFGLKASVLSGILYNDIDIRKSYLYISPETNSMLIDLYGSYASNFYGDQDIERKNFFPNFRNPGLSLSLGTTYTSKKGLTLMANLKDLGFIWWRSSTTNNTFINKRTEIEQISTGSKENNQQIKDIILSAQQPAKFTTPTNAKIDLYASKRFDFYRPALIVSKNLFYNGGDIALVNTFIVNDFSASITPQYNLNKIMMLGLQGKYQTKNFELFLGTDNLMSTASAANGIIKNDGSIGSGKNTFGASFYMGMGIKFGNIVNHPQFSDVMPGINDQDNGSFFKRIFSVFKRN